MVDEELRKRLKKQVCDVIDANRDRIIKISDTIFGYAELGTEEYKTSRLCKEELEKEGFRIRKPKATLKAFEKGLRTAFIGEMSGKGLGPCVGILGELDALIDVGHGCGHNMIAASAVGAAIGLAPALKEINGSLKIFGCPAEERYLDNSGSKAIMIDEFKPCDVTIMMHPAPRDPNVKPPAAAVGPIE
jgi:metal-dependent amidase/aminoacylase/carboxypeptidase family protein